MIVSNNLSFKDIDTILSLLIQDYNDILEYERDFSRQSQIKIKPEIY